MTIKAILFDHDGTLVDSESSHLAIWQTVLSPFGVSVSDKEYADLFLGVPTEKTADELCKRYPIPITSEQLVQLKLDQTRAFLKTSSFPQIPGAEALLAECASRLPIALVSGSQRFCIDATLDSHQWHSFFSHVVTGDDVLLNKPHPDSYLKALELLGVKGHEAIAIEDTESGANAAASAGIATVAIRNQHSATHDFSRAAIEVENLADAKAWILAQLDA